MFLLAKEIMTTFARWGVLRRVRQRLRSRGRTRGWLSRGSKELRDHVGALFACEAAARNAHGKLNLTS